MITGPGAGGGALIVIVAVSVPNPLFTVIVEVPAAALFETV
jgi:hypothetical protein